MRNINAERKDLKTMLEGLQGMESMETTLKADYSATSNTMAEGANRAFNRIKKSFESRKITIGEYRSTLAEIKDVLVSEKIKSTALNSTAMVNEIRKYLEK